MAITVTAAQSTPILDVHDVHYDEIDQDMWLDMYPELKCMLLSIQEVDALALIAQVTTDTDTPTRTNDTVKMHLKLKLDGSAVLAQCQTVNGPWILTARVCGCISPDTGTFIMQTFFTEIPRIISVKGPLVRGKDSVHVGPMRLCLPFADSVEIWVNTSTDDTMVITMKVVWFKRRYMRRFTITYE